MVVFLLCGLWHGAGWTFILWGAWHGLWLVVERALGRRTFYSALPAAVRILLTFVLVTIGWVLFRAETLGQGAELLAVMFRPQSPQGRRDALECRDLYAGTPDRYGPLRVVRVPAGAGFRLDHTAELAQASLARDIVCPCPGDDVRAVVPFVSCIFSSRRQIRDVGPQAVLVSDPSPSAC